MCTLFPYTTLFRSLKEPSQLEPNLEERLQAREHLRGEQGMTTELLEEPVVNAHALDTKRARPRVGDKLFDRRTGSGDLRRRPPVQGHERLERPAFDLAGGCSR